MRKPSDAIAVDAALAAQPAFPWVSRGGVKLADALDRFGFAVAGRVCLDVGASTGGFTQVLLARGARRVYAVDVGTGQLHPSLRATSRASSRSRRPTSARSIRRGSTSRPGLHVIDVSFISLKLVLPAAIALASRPAHMSSP